MSDTSPGFLVEPAAIINMIRENLVDRYRDAHSIVKELIQNSDDARATRMELGWSDGLGPDARHPLLKGPAVFVVNNGPFDASNAKAIRRIYLSSKSSRRDSIGQFGLGMKSVFHVCEAFFYAWERHSGGEVYAGAEVLNPWGELCHADWNEFTDHDSALLRTYLDRLLQGGRRSTTAESDWFALWLPLRQATHSDSSDDLIRERFYGGSAEEVGLFDPVLLQDLPTLLPLLRHLETLRVWQVVGGRFDQVFEALLAASSKRCGYREGMPDGTALLQGDIKVASSLDRQSTDYRYSGTEVFRDDAELGELKERGDWPRIETTDSRGMPAAVKRKAEPHGAVCFIGRAIVPTGRTPRPITLRIRWAVFLPLQPEHDEITPSGREGSEDYTLTLHGWFFVDSGRQRIDAPDVQHIGDAKPKVEHEWNRCLKENVTLPLVIPAIERLADSIGQSHPDLIGVTKAIQNSKFFDAHRASICSENQWLLTHETGESKWSTVGVDESVLYLPGGLGEQAIAWRTFSSLDHLSSRAAVTFQSAPRLAPDDGTTPWPLEDVETLLRVDVAAVFADPETLDYCASFVRSLPPEMRDDRRIQDALVALGQKAFHLLGLRTYLDASHNDLRKALASLLTWVHPSRLVSVARPAGLDKVFDEALQAIAGTAGGILVVPSDLFESSRPEGSPDGGSVIALIRAISALQELAAKGDTKRAPAMIRAHAWIARSLLLRVSDAALANVVAALDDCALFPVKEYQLDAETRVSLAGLRERQNTGVLFSGVPRYARSLQSAVPGLQLCGINMSGAPVVDEELQVRVLDGQKMPRCDVHMCVRILRDAEALNEKREPRMALFESLVKDAPDLSESALVACLRYLLHGQHELLHRELHSDDAAEILLVEGEGTGLAWRVLLEAVIARRSEEWRRLPYGVCQKLNGEQMQRLGIRKVDRSAIVELLSKMDPGELSEIRLSDDDARREVLREWPAAHLDILSHLALHRQVGTGDMVAIDEHTFLQGAYKLPEVLASTLPIKLVESGPEYEYWATRGSPLADTFDLEHALLEVLQLDGPHLHWQFVLDALTQLDGSCGEDTRQQLAETAWVPTSLSRAVAPEDVVSCPALENLLPELIGRNAKWVAWLDVDSTVRAHSKSETTIRRCLTIAQSARGLFEVLSERSVFQVGAIDLHDSQAFETWVAALRGEADAMPAARVVAALVKDLGTNEVRSLLHEFLAKGDLSLARLRSILDSVREHHAQLSADHKADAASLHNQYLTLLARHSDATSCLRHLQLLNQQGKWTASTSLCLDSPGVSRAALVERDQEAIIRRCLSVADAAARAVATSDEGDESEAAALLPKGDLESAFDRSASRLEEYFANWGRRISPSAIGGLFAFLGDHEAMRELATQYLRPRSIPEVRHRVPWSLPIVMLDDGRKVTRPDKDGIDAQMRRRRFIIECVAAGFTIVPNLFGDDLQVNLAQDYQHIVLHHRTTWIGAAAGIGVTWIQLRTVPPDRLQQPDEARDLLAGTLMWLLETVFHQRPGDDGIADIVDPDRDLGALNVRIVQNVLLDALPVYLQQISYRGSGEVKAYLDSWSRTTYAKAEAELELDRAGGGHEEAREAHSLAEKEQRQLRESMRQVLLDDGNFQHEILQSVRQKMQVAQYSASSIPFELFQNADDAVSEWAEMRGEDAPLTAAHRRFVISESGGALSVLHWGRPVNRARLGEFDGSTRRYQDDLLKMLTIAGSDKSAEEYRAITTGRFGYGFKSTFFLSETPMVVSGLLGIRIVAGFYPDDLSDTDFAQLRDIPERWDDPMLEADEPTVIHLPYDGECEDAVGFLSRFSQLMALLPLFARGIDRIVFERDDGPQRHVSWAPRPIEGVRGCVIGSTRVPVRRAGAEAVDQDVQCLVLQVGPPGHPTQCRLLLALDGAGIVSLADVVPSIWVTAPTQESLQLGFAFHGPLELHIARDSVAPESTANDALAGEAGARLGEVLVELFARTQCDWSSIRESLSLTDDAQEYTFWLSMWCRLGEAVARMSGASPAENFLRTLLWGENGAARYLIGHCAALPTGLPDTDPLEPGLSYKRLVRLDEPEQVVVGYLADENVFLEVAFWARFSKKWSPGKLLHSDVGATLARLMSAHAPHLGKLQLAEVLENELDPGPCASVATASIVGGLVSPEFVAASRKNDARRPADEDQQLEDLLESVKFQALDRGWYPAESLVVGHDPADGAAEDRLRAAFAPAEHVLNEAYEGAALEFFHACRYGRGQKASVIAKWIARGSLSDEQRRAALAYLAKSKRADAVGQCLQDMGQTWLTKLSRTHVLFDGVDQRDVAFAMQHAGAAEWEQFVRGELHPMGPSLIEEVEEAALPDDGVLRLAAWWRRRGNDYIERYYERLFPDGQHPQLFVREVRDDPPILEDGDAERRRGWMMMFLLGALQTMGRSRAEQHRGFVRKCLSRGWMDTFATPPHSDPDRWLRLLNEYFDPQLDDQEYLQWMSLYPRIYQFSHWLHQYVWWLKILDHKDRLTLPDLLHPRVSQHGQGTEIDAPPLIRALGMGSCFLIREMIRVGFIENPEKWRRFCFMPVKRVRALTSRLGLCDLKDGNVSSQERIEQSAEIYDALAEALPDPTFGGAYDIPLLIVAEDAASLEEAMSEEPLSKR